MKRAASIALVVAALVAAFGIGWSAKGNAATAMPATPQAALTARLTALTGSDAAGTGNPQTAKTRYEGFVAAVAAKAGVSASTLDNAIRSVVEQRVQQAADAGGISQAAATKIENAIKNGTLGQLIRQHAAAGRAHGDHPLLRWFRRLALH